uniref:Telomeric single stranded DNA binding POT1/Cdc13 domain-containing protein n=1 Tax=Cannabis sativa TaxID=3483 RepID=A0A803Q4K9_CANSA
MRHRSDLKRIREAVTLYNSRRKSSQKFNLVGFVIEFSLPRKSQGTDYVTTIRVVDELLSELFINMFAEKEEHLPHLKSYKDLIVLNNVMMKHYVDGDEICAVYYKQTSSFALFDVKTTTNTPYQTSPGFHLQKDDIPCITSMRALSSRYEVSAGRNEYLMTIKDLGTKMFFDLVCQVLYVQKLEVGCMLFVWDGNDAPPLKVQTMHEDEELSPLPLEIEPKTLNMLILRKFPCVGSLLRVKAPVDMSAYFQEEMGQWVKIRNMKCEETKSGLWLGTLLPTTKVRLLPNSDPIVMECKRAMDERGVGRQGRSPLGSNPLSGLTVVDPKEFPYATLMDLITHTEIETIVRCVVRVVAISPSNLDSFLNQNEECKIILTLEDPTARIHALLDSQHWGVFFEDFTSDDSDALKRMKMNKLLGCERDHRNPPWIECCIKSNGNRIYFICNTKLVP